MVGRNQCYHGSTQTPLLYHYNTQIIQVYKGSELIYQIGFDPITILPGASLQAWTVPVGVTKIHVDCVASSGYGSTDSDGKGGRVECDLNVTAGQILYFTVGQKSTSRQTPQYNASDVRTDNTGVTDSTSLQSRIIVAGGGGCRATSHNSDRAGGNGGGLEGQKGADGYRNGIAGIYTYGGGGGTQSSGGSAGYVASGVGGNGSAGGFGLGGSAPGGNAGYGKWGYGGAGGAGYYGGGGGAWSYLTGFSSDNTGTASGGGGGSSYTNSDCSNVTHTQGYQNGDGYITISFVG